MYPEKYEPLVLSVTEFDHEDVIATSETSSGASLNPITYEGRSFWD